MDAAINRVSVILRRNGVQPRPPSLVVARAVACCDRRNRADGAAPVSSRTSTIFRSSTSVRAVLPHAGEWSSPSHGHDHDHHEGDQAAPERIVFDPDDRGVLNTDGEHAHGEPVPIRDYFEPDKIVTRANPHQDPNQLSLSGLGQELILNRNKGLWTRR